MSNPSTPSKKGEGINEIVKALNSRWNLHIPVKSEPWSPSKVPNRNATEEKIFTTIRFLYWKSQESLQLALDQFDEHAIYISSQWVFRPRADFGTLSTCHPSESQLRSDSFLYRQEIPPSAQVDLKKALLRFLEEVKRDFSPVKLSRLSSVEPEVDRLPPPSSTNRRLFARTQSLGCPQHQSDVNLPSSDDFSLSPGMADIYKTIEMADGSSGQFYIPQKAANKTQSAASVLGETASDEIFPTPPTSPLSLATRSKRPNRSDSSMFIQNPDPAKLPGRLFESRKRFTDDPFRFSFPEKTPRETESHESPRLGAVTHMELQRHTEPYRDLTRSFESAPSQTFSVETASTARTTPNTSFYGATSFELPGGEDDLASLQLRREAAASDYVEPMKACIESVGDAMEIDLNFESLTTAKPRLDRNCCITPTTLQKEPDFTVEDLGSFPIQAHEEDPTNNLSPVTVGLNSNPEQFSDRIIDLEEKSPAPEKRGNRLVNNSPFSLIHSPKQGCSFRNLYEISRVALHYDVPVSDLSDELQGRGHLGYDELWSILSRRWSTSDKPMPERSSPAAWKKAEGKFEGITLSGEFSYSKRSEGPVFDFSLRPLKLEQSYRLSRKFGGDRFFVLGIPGFDHNELPSHLQKDAYNFRAEVISWIANIEQCFLGRTWRAFFVKTAQFGKRLRRLNAAGEIKYRVYFFAMNGQDFSALNEAAQRKGGSHFFREPMSIETLLDWFMPAKANLDQPALKLFARLQLAVSTTDPTIVFEPRQIIRCYDAYASSPGERRLATNCYQYKMGSSAKTKNESPVMNDGCARISRTAAMAIATKLNLNHMPSAYQGRIGGAKGVWMVDVIGERSPEYFDEIWIEITDSQLKFEGHEIDMERPDLNRVTFEVNKYSKILSSSSLNFQLIPILVDRGVPSDVFTRLLDEDLKVKVGNLESAMEDGLRLRCWNQENNSVTMERLTTGTIETVGGIPSSEAERINWFAEHGFEPMECLFLKNLCYTAADTFCQRLEKRMRIGVGRSTMALMIADPLGILEEDEVHLGFSSCFFDEKSGFQDTMLHRIDVLVARNPAHLPSDIQKVHATFRPELSIYKDVIIFPSRGKCSLAEKLSGGDFDGDQAWVCWEPDIVNPFTNEEDEGYIAKGLDYYGISKDSTMVSDMINERNFIDQFLYKGFDFNIQSPMLGICSYYHEAYCYREGSINSPQAKDLAILLGKLVDSAKGGFIFTGDDWHAFRRKCHIPHRLDKPAYKADSEPTPHVIDQLVLVVAKGIRERALNKFNARFKGAVDYDYDLVALWNYEAENAKKDKELSLILKNLVSQLKKVHDFWVANIKVRNPSSDRGTSSEKPNLSFTAVAQDARARFLSIKPLESSTHILAQRWRKELCEYWDQLKASALFYHWNNLHWGNKSFPWYVAGKELGDMKVVRSEGGGERIIKAIHVATKLDAKLARRVEDDESTASFMEDIDEWEEDFDGWDELV